MSGHSKWSSIKHKKGAADAKRGKLFSKLSRAIIVAAKEGGGDPANNLALQNAIEKAKSYSMPKDNIDRAVAKGSGADADADAFETIVYEGYGPEGVAVIVEALTDNRNRTAADVRFAFSKFGGSLGTPGSVAWMFERKGVITIPVEAVDEDTITMTAAEGGAEDVRQDGDTWVVTSEPHDFPALRTALEAASIPIDNAGLSLLPKTQVEVDADQARTLLRMVDLLEESDDVQDVYFNFDIPDAVLADA
jgi:YebC/PmpR family DNA-binding regulatory protein